MKKLLLVVAICLIFKTVFAEGWTQTRSNCNLQKRYHSYAKTSQITPTQLAVQVVLGYDPLGNPVYGTQITTVYPWVQMAYDHEKICNGSRKAEAQTYAYYNNICKVAHAIAINGDKGPSVFTYTNDLNLRAGECGYFTDTTAAITFNHDLQDNITDQISGSTIEFSGNQVVIPSLKFVSIQPKCFNALSTYKIVIAINTAQSDTAYGSFLNNDCEYPTDSFSVLYETVININNGVQTSTNWFNDQNYEILSTGSYNVCTLSATDFSYTIPDGVNLDDVVVLMFADNKVLGNSMANKTQSPKTVKTQKVSSVLNDVKLMDQNDRILLSGDNMNKTPCLYSIDGRFIGEFTKIENLDYTFPNNLDEGIYIVGYIQNGVSKSIKYVKK